MREISLLVYDYQAETEKDVKLIFLKGKENVKPSVKHISLWKWLNSEFSIDSFINFIVRYFKNVQDIDTMMLCIHSDLFTENIFGYTRIDLQKNIDQCHPLWKVVWKSVGNCDYNVNKNLKLNRYF